MEKELIQLKGRREGDRVPFENSKHVKLSDGFYEKSDSDNVVSISGRYYRKNSPLITELSTQFYGINNYALLEDCVKDCISDEYIFMSDSKNIEGALFFNSYGIQSAGKGLRTHYNTGVYILKDLDINVPRDYHFYCQDISKLVESGDLVSVDRGRRFVKKDYIVPLHESYGSSAKTFLGLMDDKGNYIKTIKQLISSGFVTEINGIFHYTNDISWSSDREGNKYKPIVNEVTGYRIDSRINPYTRSRCLNNSIRRAFEAIISSKSGVRGAINDLLRSNWFTESRLDSDFSEEIYSTKIGIQVGSKSDAKLIDAVYDMMKDIYPEAKKAVLLESFTWFGPVHREKIPPLFTGNSVGNQGGDYVYNINKANFIESQGRYSKTGGIGYTFGVELETEKGVLPLELARLTPVNCVGDRSIGGLEYVTGVLSGDSGMDKLSEICETISDYTMVADTCGLHVHVGGDGSSWNPVFDKEFSVLSIMLGCLIEDELFSLLPSNRREKRNSNGQSYCESILGYSDISMRNWKEKLFEFVYGRKPEDSSEGFGDIKSLVESRHQVGRWGAGRYKWLNLVNCTTDNSGRRNGGGFKTIEFRAFNSTLNKEEVWAFVIISLAFVAFVEKNRSSIPSLKRLSISEMISATMDHDTALKMRNWISNKMSQIRSVKIMKEPNILNSI